MRIVGRAADEAALDLEFRHAHGGEPGENLLHLAHHFGADAVAGQEEELVGRHYPSRLRLPGVLLQKADPDGKFGSEFGFVGPPRPSPSHFGIAGLPPGPDAHETSQPLSGAWAFPRRRGHGCGLQRSFHRPAPARPDRRQGEADESRGIRPPAGDLPHRPARGRSQRAFPPRPAGRPEPRGRGRRRQARPADHPSGGPGRATISTPATRSTS